MFREIIDIKTYLTNIQTPRLSVGGVCVFLLEGCGEQKKKKNKRRRIKGIIRRRKGLKKKEKKA